MIRRTPRSTLTEPLFPDTTLFRAVAAQGVTVNTIAPGRINSAQVLSRLHPTEESRRDFITRNIPIGYFGEPEDIGHLRSEEHTSELQSLMRISYAVFCLKKNIETELNTRR